MRMGIAETTRPIHGDEIQDLRGGTDLTAGACKLIQTSPELGEANRKHPSVDETAQLNACGGHTRALPLPFCRQITTWAVVVCPRTGQLASAAVRFESGMGEQLLCQALRRCYAPPRGARAWMSPTREL